MRKSLRSTAALAWTLTGCAAAPRGVTHVVIAPVADLRATRGLSSPGGAHDPFQETQVLYGEGVHLVKLDDGWASVEAVEQPEYTHHRTWQGYPGWVSLDLLQPVRQPPPTNAVISITWAKVWEHPHATTSQLQLPMGAKVWVAPNDEELWAVGLLSGEPGWVSRGAVTLFEEMTPWSASVRRERILRLAEQFLGDPYFWGGRSPYAGPSSAIGTGVDCSGLVNLVYRTAGLSIPRDAHEQRSRARAVTQPEPADLIFLSERDRPETTVHVMLYAGDGWLIEGPGTGLAVRRIRVVERLGLPIEELQSGERVEQQTIDFGSYFP